MIARQINKFIKKVLSSGDQEAMHVDEARTWNLNNEVLPLKIVSLGLLHDVIISACRNRFSPKESGRCLFINTKKREHVEKQGSTRHRSVRTYDFAFRVPGRVHVVTIHFSRMLTSTIITFGNVHSMMSAIDILA